MFVGSGSHFRVWFPGFLGGGPLGLAHPVAARVVKPTTKPLMLAKRPDPLARRDLQNFAFLSSPDHPCFFCSLRIHSWNQNPLHFLIIANAFTTHKIALLRTQMCVEKPFWLREKKKTRDHGWFGKVKDVWFCPTMNFGCVCPLPPLPPPPRTLLLPKCE